MSLGCLIINISSIFMYYVLDSLMTAQNCLIYEINVGDKSSEFCYVNKADEAYLIQISHF